MKEDSNIIKDKLTNESFFYLKENYMSKDDLFSFNKFKIVWEEVIGKNNYFIPIEKKYRKDEIAFSNLKIH